MKKVFLLIMFICILFYALAEIKDTSIGIRLVKVIGGTFNMPGKLNFLLNDFYIGEKEITQKEYEKIMGYNPSYSKKDTFPVNGITFYDAIEFCNRLSDFEKLNKVYTIYKDKNEISNTRRWIIDYNREANGYRLPTEAEWEYAASGGIISKKFKYSGSNDFNQVAWLHTNSNGEIKDVALKQPNELGIFDMSGNVLEWCFDYYHEKLPEGNNPVNNTRSLYRVVRGGSYVSIDYYLTFRDNRYPYASAPALGFRIARNLY